MVGPENVIKQAILDYGLNIPEEEAAEMAKLALEYRSNKDIKLYAQLPPTCKKIVDNLHMNANSTVSGGRKNAKIGKESVSRMLFDSFINDAELENLITEFNNEMNNAYSEMGSEMNKLLSDAYDEVFDRIDEIRENDPEAAERIESVRRAFDRATTFDIQIDYVNRLTSKRMLRKRLIHYSDSINYFNKKVNENPKGIKVHDIGELMDALKIIIPGKSDEDYKYFIIAIINSIIYNNDFEIGDSLENIAYVYKLIDNIYKYKVYPTLVSESSDEYVNMYKSIALVMDKINSL